MNKPTESQDKPPAPGGDPDQPPNDLPQPAEPGAGKRRGKDKSGFGHIGNKDVPSSKDVPPPRQIY